MQYRAGPRGDYVVRPVDDLTLIYHRLSGETHAVAPVVVAILDVLHDKVLGAAEVIAELNMRHEFDEAPEAVAQAVTARLGELANSGLVDQVS